jgi:hypothetical protein
MTRETIHKENESIWDEAIPTINAEAKSIRSATNNSWAYRDCFLVRVLIDVNKIRYIIQRMRIPIENNNRK